MEKARSHDRRNPSTGSTSKRRNSEISGERDGKEHPPSPSAAGKSNKRRPQETPSFHHYSKQGSNRPKKQKVYAQPAPIERPALLDEPSLVSLLGSGQRRMFPTFFPLLFSIEPFLTRLVPPLPSVIDPDLLATIWDIFGEKSINGRIYEKKTEEWSTLEWLGDGVLAWKARSILSKIFGEDNYRLSKALVDHAKGNGFLLEVGKAYHLDKWTKESPSDEKDKLWADMVEVWLGAAEVERQLWGESDYCSETEIFLDQLWTIRYGKLLDNWISSDIEPVSKDEVAVQFDIFDIDIPKSKEIMRLCSFSTTMNNRNVGYLVEASVKPTKQSKSTDTLVARSLCSSSETAQRQAADKLYQLLRRMSLFINLIIDRQQPDRQSSGEPDLSSPPSQSPTLFQKYRLRIFQHIREQMTKNDSTVSPNSIIMKVEDKYCQWIIELQKTLPSKDQLKTITMLRWYQVPFPIFDADFSYTFIRERTTLRCLTFALKRC
jgi:hypothetical protein